MPHRSKNKFSRGEAVHSLASYPKPRRINTGPRNQHTHDARRGGQPIRTGSRPDGPAPQFKEHFNGRRVDCISV